MSDKQPQENENKRIRFRRMVWLSVRKPLLYLVVGIAVAWGLIFAINKVVDAVTEPIASVTEPIGNAIGKGVEAIDTAAENAAKTLERGTATQRWELTQVEPVGDLKFAPVECPAIADVQVKIVMQEVHGRLIFGTDTDTFTGTVPVHVRPCLYLDAVTVSPDQKTITVDASRMHFDPDPRAVEFMTAYLLNRNPGDESGIERLAESGWLPFVGIFQGLINDPERTEISGIMIALGESAAANSACIDAMWEGVREFTIRFYEEQAARQGVHDVTVKVVGEPDLYQNQHLLDDLLAAAKERGIELEIDHQDVLGTCEINIEQ